MLYRKTILHGEPMLDHKNLLDEENHPSLVVAMSTRFAAAILQREPHFFTHPNFSI